MLQKSNYHASVNKRIMLKVLRNVIFRDMFAFNLCHYDGTSFWSKLRLKLGAVLLLIYKYMWQTMSFSNWKFVAY